MTLTVTDEGYQPDDPYVGEQVADTLTAKLSPVATAGESVSYAWTASPVWFSSSDAPGSFAVDETSTDYKLTLGVPNGADAVQQTLGAIFNVPGFFVIEATCTATVVSNGVTTVLTGNCYVGGAPSTIVSP
jgi:hypothetical protein